MTKEVTTGKVTTGKVTIKKVMTNRAGKKIQIPRLTILDFRSKV